MSKKFTYGLVTAVVLAVAVAASPASAAITSQLAMGSTGPEVIELQTFLVNKGLLTMPAGVPMGYFGNLTKAAVMAYQASKGIPQVGQVGPLTRAAIAADMAMVTSSGNLPPGCTSTVGYSPTTGAKCDGSTTNTGGGGGITTPNVAGSLEVTIRSTPANGTDVKKGETKDVASYKLEAGDSDMEINNISLLFNKRLWLFADSVTLTDGSKTIASISGLSASDFTEVTSGSSYRLRFNNVKYVVPANSTKVMTVKIKMLGFTDRSDTTITINKLEIRATDGTGFTSTETEDTARTFDFVAANAANVVVTLSANSKSKRIVQTSTSGETDVELGIYNLKSENRSSKLKELSIGVQTSSGSLTTIFKDIKIEVGGQEYSADSIAATSTFTDLDIDLPQNERVAVKVMAVVADADDFADGISASTTIYAVPAAVVAEDSNYDSATVSGGQVTTNDVVLSKSGGTVTNMFFSMPATAPTFQSAYASIVSFRGGFRFNAGDRGPLYISTTPSIAFSTSTNSTMANASSTLSNFVADGRYTGRDTTSFFYVPAGGDGENGYRDFTFTVTMDNGVGAAGAKTFGVTAVKFTDDTSDATKYTIDFGLEDLNSNFGKTVLLGQGS